ncbi:MAG: tRNA lysidine(34) synthetase TilS [Lachnospiraceae bacterium]|nr:tRNA lysidine(34) synthetase TilS [Lachnospiraceae bacterium]
MIDKVRHYIQLHHMLTKGSRVVMGISGGADSTAMFLLLLQLREEYALSLYVVHINHGIRPEAAEDAEYVRQISDKNGIPFYLYEADIPSLARQQQKSEEEMGREYRYQCFYEVMEKTGADTLAVAHHMGDQAETVLFHMVRGTDLTGLRGILPVQTEPVKIIRPLLCCEKEELIDWLEAQQVVWQEDITNKENIYMRNKLRNEVMPLLEQVNSRAVSHLAALADTAAEYHAFFCDCVQEYIAENVCIIKEDTGVAGEIKRKSLLSEKQIFAKAVIYEMLSKVCGSKKDLTKEHVQAVYGLLENQSGKKISLPYGTEAIISYEKLQIRKSLEQGETILWKEPVFPPGYFGVDRGEETDFCQTVEMPFAGRLQLDWIETQKLSVHQRENLLFYAKKSKNSYTKFFDCDTIKDTLYIRMVEKGDYIVINEQGGTKKLSRYFIDTKVPRDQRENTIVLAADSEVLWIVGGRRSERFKVKDDTEYILKVTYEGESDDESG